MNNRGVNKYEYTYGMPTSRTGTNNTKKVAQVQGFALNIDF